MRMQQMLILLLVMIIAIPPIIAQSPLMNEINKIPISSVSYTDAFGQDIQGNIISINGQKISSPKYGATNIPVYAQSDMQVEVKMHNYGVSGCQRVEVGIYPTTDVNNWYPKLAILYSPKTIDNCKDGEPNVQTKEICLPANKEVIVTYNIKTNQFSDGIDYTLVVNSYECCYNAVEVKLKNTEGQLCSLNKGDKNYYTQYFQRIDLNNVYSQLGFKLFPKDCNDKQKNNKETDVDCGGLVCGIKCDNGKYCGQSNDCKSALCKEGICISEPNCGDERMNGDETGVDCGGSKCSPCETPKPIVQDGVTTGDGSGKLKGVDIDYNTLMIWIYAITAIVGIVLYFYTPFMWTAITFIFVGVLLFLIKLFLG